MIKTIDLEFQGLKGAIAVYLIEHKDGAVLVECGPGSTASNLGTKLEQHNLSYADITDVLVTHIHLDHAGAAGWLANQGARIHVHPVGAPHMLNPERLLESASRIYGNKMDSLWGDFLPVPEDKLSVVEDGDEIRINELCFRAIATPGHASHHHAYILDDTCFSGDIGGVRVGGLRHLQLPMPPPEFNLEKWRESLARLREEYKSGAFSKIAPTHFGIYEDAGWHLDEIASGLDEVEGWIAQTMPHNYDIQELRRLFTEWSISNSLAKGVDADLVNIQEAANPAFMSADGIHRYWRKHRKTA
jgi:glyoxylase-like metal-dependent hydrolase (beta-lactamase superfamily II)